jgi:hypothetical protein
MSSKKTRYAVSCDKMTTAERTSSEIRDGVIVYDTDLHQFFKIEDGLWAELGSGGGSSDDPVYFPTGWGSYNDTQYTSASPFSVAADTDTILPNNKGNTIEIQKPEDVVTFYDGTVITGRNGDSLDIMIYFKAVPSLWDQWLEIWVDIGGSVGELYRQAFNFPRGGGIERGLTYSISSGYTLDTWEANGGTVYVRTNAALDIYDIVYNFDRSHKAV